MMRTHDSIDSLWMWAVYDALQGSTLQSRIGECKEVIGYSTTLTNPKANWLFNPDRNLVPHYAGGETLWYLAGSDKIEMIGHYAPSYVNYSDDGVSARGAYGPRIMHVLQDVIQMLHDEPHTRQAVIPIYQPQDLVAATQILSKTKDVPCTLNLQLLVRDGRVNMICNMRSNDVWMGMPYDIFAFTTIQRVIADSLKLEVGTYTHNVGSLHVYAKHYERAQEAVSSPIKPFALEFASSGNARYSVPRAVEIERGTRREGSFVFGGDFGCMGEHSILTALVAMAACKVDTRAIAFIPDKRLREYCEEHYGTGSN